MLDFSKAQMLPGWVTERQACEDWFRATFRPVDCGLVDDPDNARYLRCCNLPEAGDAISKYGEFGGYGDFRFEVESLDAEKRSSWPPTMKRGSRSISESCAASNSAPCGARCDRSPANRIMARFSCTTIAASGSTRTNRRFRQTGAQGDAIAVRR